MAKKPTPKPNQHKLFVETAREIGADEEHSAADALIGRLAKMPPSPKTEAKNGTKKTPRGDQ